MLLDLTGRFLCCKVPPKFNFIEMSQFDLAEVVEAHTDQFLPVVMERLPFEVDDGFLKDLRKFVREAISDLMSRAGVDSLEINEENVLRICQAVGRKCIATAVAMAGDAHAFAAIGAGLGSSVEVIISASMRNSGVISQVALPSQAPVVRVVEPVDGGNADIELSHREPEPVPAPAPASSRRFVPNPNSLEHYIEQVENLSFEMAASLMERAFFERNEEAITAFGQHVLLAEAARSNWIDLIRANTKIANILLHNNRPEIALKHAEKSLSIQMEFAANSRPHIHDHETFLQRIRTRIASDDKKNDSKPKDKAVLDDSTSFGAVFDSARSAVERRSIDDLIAVRGRLLALDNISRNVAGALIRLHIDISKFFDFIHRYAEALEHRRAILKIQEATNPNDSRIGITRHIISVLEWNVAKELEKEGLTTLVHDDEIGDKVVADLGSAVDTSDHVVDKSGEVASGTNDNAKDKDAEVASGANDHDGANDASGETKLDEVAQKWLDENFSEAKPWQRATIEYLLRHEGKSISRKSIFAESSVIQLQFSTEGSYCASVSGFLKIHSSISPFRIESSTKGTRLVRTVIEN